MAEMMKYIKGRFDKYRTYYQILQLVPNNLTDEKVKEVYENKCNQLNKILEGYNENDADEIRNMIQTTLDDAYNALKTEDSRRHYQNILNKIEENER